MEKNKQHLKSARQNMSAFLLPLAVGAVVFVLCVLLLPFPMMRYSDPASLISAACVVTVSLTAFFSAFTAARASTLHFALCAGICTLIIAALLFGCGAVFGDGNDFTFTAVMSAAALVFSLLGAKIAVRRKKSGKRSRRRQR